MTSVKELSILSQNNLSTNPASVMPTFFFPQNPELPLLCIMITVPFFLSSMNPKVSTKECLGEALWLEMQLEGYGGQ